MSESRTTSTTPSTTDSLKYGALATLSITAAQAILTDLLKPYCEGKPFLEDLPYCINQLVRAGVLCAMLDTSIYRAAASPLLQHYIYQLFRNQQLDVRKTDATAETIALVASTALLLGFDIVTSPWSNTTYTETALTGVGSIVTYFATKATTNTAYQWIKRGFFGGTVAQPDAVAENPAVSILKGAS